MGTDTGGPGQVPQGVGDDATVEQASLSSQSQIHATSDGDGDSPVMELMSEKVPLSLIIDLSAPAGPDSEQILDDEGEPEDAWWEPIS